MDFCSSVMDLMFDKDSPEERFNEIAAQLMEFGVSERMLSQNTVEHAKSPVGDLVFKEAAVTNNSKEAEWNSTEREKFESVKIETVLSYVPSNFEIELPEITPINIVCSSNVGCLLDLAELNGRFQNSSWQPKRFPALFLQLHEPKITILIYANGSCVATGCKRYEDGNKLQFFEEGYI